MIYAQLDFYHHVMLAGWKQVPSELFTKSKAGKKFDAEGMMQKLLKVIKFATTHDPNDDNVPAVKMRPQEEQDTLVKEQLKEIESKIYNSRLFSHISKKNAKNIPKLMVEPERLIGLKIRHCVKETTDVDENWTIGEVTGVHAHTPDPRKTKFSVHYLEDEDDVSYNFPLILDMEKNLCFVLSELQ